MKKLLYISICLISFNIKPSSIKEDPSSILNSITQHKMTIPIVVCLTGFITYKIMKPKKNNIQETNPSTIQTTNQLSTVQQSVKKHKKNSKVIFE